MSERGQGRADGLLFVSVPRTQPPPNALLLSNDNDNDNVVVVVVVAARRRCRRWPSVVGRWSFVVGGVLS